MHFCKPCHLASVVSCAALALASCEKPAETYYTRPSGAEAAQPHDGGAAPPQPPPIAAQDSGNQAAPPEARDFSGRVTETYDSDSGTYTYAKLALAEGGEAWVAGPQTALAKGQLVLVRSATLQRGFPTRQRTFDELWLAQAFAAETTTAPREGASPPPSNAKAEPVAPAEGGVSIAAIRAQAKELAGRTVRVRGRVTRVSPMVGGTWVHMQDGSADAAIDDLTFILAEGEAGLAPGAIAVLEGELRLDHEMARAHRPEAIVVANARQSR